MRVMQENSMNLIRVQSVSFLILADTLLILSSYRSRQLARLLFRGARVTGALLWTPAVCHVEADRQKDRWTAKALCTKTKTILKASRHSRPIRYSSKESDIVRKVTSAENLEKRSDLKR